MALPDSINNWYDYRCDLCRVEYLSCDRKSKEETCDRCRNQDRTCTLNGLVSRPPLDPFLLPLDVQLLDLRMPQWDCTVTSITMSVAESRSPEDIWQLNLHCDSIVVSFRQVRSTDTPPSKARVEFRRGTLEASVGQALRPSSSITVRTVFHSLIAKGYGQTGLWLDGTTGNGIYMCVPSPMHGYDAVHGN